MNLNPTAALEAQIERLLKRRDDAALIATVTLMLCVLSLFSEKALRVYVFWGAACAFVLSTTVLALALRSLRRIARQVSQ